MSSKKGNTHPSAATRKKWWFDKQTVGIHVCGGKEPSECGSIHRIGQILCYYRRWLNLKQRDKLKYGMYEFLHSGTKVPHFQNTNKLKLEAKESKDHYHYSSAKLLEDYHHILYDHDDEDALEAVYDYINKQYLSNTVCKPRQCNLLSRNNRDRWSLSMNNAKRINLYSGNDESKQVYVLKLCDRIHSTLIHTFDFGYKLNKKNKDKIKKKTTSLSVHKRLKYIHDVMIKPKRKNISKVRSSQRYKNNKFISVYDLNELEIKEEEEDDEEENDDNESLSSEPEPIEEIEPIEFKEFETKATEPKYIEYSFGFPYKYWQCYKNDEWFVCKKYKDLRTELVNNTVHKISVNQFNDELKSVIDLVNCKRGKALKCNYFAHKKNEPQFEHIGIEINSSIKIDHLLALVFITNYDHLRRKFTATYKKKNDNESKEELIQRHSSFHQLGRLSFELIHLFGTNDNISTNIWYHGFDQQMIFHDTFLTFECITSTTSNFNVALSYSNGIGLILALKPLNCTYFDCRWASDYSNEYEFVFVQNECKLLSILNISLFADYEWYLNVLCIMKSMFNGMCAQDSSLVLTPKIYSFLSKLVNDKITAADNTIDNMKSIQRRVSLFGAGFISFDSMQDNKEEDTEHADTVQPYVVELFKRYFKDKTGLIMNIWSMNVDQFEMFNDPNHTYFGYKLIRNLFMDDEDDGCYWIYFPKLTDLCPNVELICIYNVDWINGNKLPSIKLNDNFGNKLLSFLSLDNSALIDIWIYLPNEEEINISSFITKYDAQFSYIKWKATEQKKQIPGLKEKLGDINTLCITYKGQQRMKVDANDENVIDEANEDSESDSDSY